ncbi:hypothetical protein BO71DRAFT_49494 [Aspergillus ellipticus CBS 707.79]|uniref:Uncharacterized protein n=1 Tax=Aspergillus ellipticus CBS 707.79 TaxID=1448320 RepID=A0A319DM40_9EURO|nr:hypothetical protein BO71DRAFT_49494 [Aspergillus ellipticus CBS 707.79]
MLMLMLRCARQPRRLSREPPAPTLTAARGLTHVTITPVIPHDRSHLSCFAFYTTTATTVSFLCLLKGHSGWTHASVEALTSPAPCLVSLCRGIPSTNGLIWPP